MMMMMALLSLLIGKGQQQEEGDKLAAKMATQIALKRRVKRQGRKPLGKTWEELAQRSTNVGLDS